MRIRSIKPEFWRSDDVAALTRDFRLLFVGLWSYVDDNGVGVDDYRQIAADLFALDDDQKEVREFVREGLARLSGSFLIARYKVDGKPYLYVTGWPKHQRIDKPGRPRFPKPPSSDLPLTSENADQAEEFATPSRESRDTLAPGTEEQGNRGTEEQGIQTRSAAGATARAPRAPRADTAAGFEAFWTSYPRRVGKGKAAQVFAAAVKGGVSPDHIVAAAGRYAAATEHTETRYIAHPTTWLNQGRWDDEVDQPRRPRTRAQEWAEMTNALGAPVIDAEIVEPRALT